MFLNLVLSTHADDNKLVEPQSDSDWIIIFLV